MRGGIDVRDMLACLVQKCTTSVLSVRLVVVKESRMNGKEICFRGITPCRCGAG